MTRNRHAVRRGEFSNDHLRAYGNVQLTPSVRSKGSLPTPHAFQNGIGGGWITQNNSRSRNRIGLAEQEILTPSTDSESSVVSAWVSQPWIHALQRLVLQLENEPWLAEPNKLRERLEALDRLDAYYPFAPQVAGGSESFGPLPRRVKAIRDRLEAANTDLYEAIRCQIQRGSGAHGLLRWIPPSLAIEDLDESANGMGYDYVDELISGVFQFEEPHDGHIPRDSEMLFYQPTPARHIFRLIGLTALTADDVFVDLGSRMGHVSILVSICTYARSFGIELEGSYVECAQQCARRLNLKQATFIQ